MAFDSQRKPTLKKPVAPRAPEARSRSDATTPRYLRAPSAGAPGAARGPLLPRYLTPSQSAGERPAADAGARGSVDLSQGRLDSEKLVLDEHGRVDARLPGLAEGELELERRGEAYSSRGEGSALPLTLGPLAGVLDDALVLVVRVEDNRITGHVAVGRPGPGAPRGDAALWRALEKGPEALGWGGLSRLVVGTPSNVLEDGRLKLGAESARFTLGGFVEGTARLGLEGERVHFEGTAEVKLPGASSGRMEVRYEPETGLSGAANLKVGVGKMSGSVEARLRQGEWDIQGTAGYAGGGLQGQVTLMATDAETARDVTRQPPDTGALPGPRATGPGVAGGARPGPRALCGWGELDFALTDWLTGRAQVVVNNEGEATVRGEIAPPKEVLLFARKEWTRSLVKAEARAMYGVPVVGNVFVFANVGLEALATVGPGRLYNIKLSGQYSTDPRVDREVNLSASLNIPASAGLRLRAEGGAGMELLDHDIKFGVGVWALAGVAGEVEATPTIGYRRKAGGPGEYYLGGRLELVALPLLGLGGDLFVEVDSPAWSPLPDEKWTWPLGSLEYPLPGALGLGAEMEHVLGSQQWPQLELSEVEFDSGRFMTDLLSGGMPRKSKGGGDKAPAKWNEGRERGGTRQTRGAGAPGVTPGGGGGAKPQGRDKPRRQEPRADGVTLPVRMGGASHTLYVQPEAGGRVEMASRRELLSTKVGRGVAALLRSRRDAEALGEQPRADALRKQADDLMAIGGLAKQVQREAVALRATPHKDLSGAQKGVQLASLRALMDGIHTYGETYRVTEVDELLGGVLATQTVKHIEVKQVRILKEKLSAKLVPALGKSAGGVVHQGRKLEPRTLVTMLTSRHGATYHQDKQKLELQSPDAEKLGRQESLSGLGAEASRQTGAPRVEVNKDDKQFYVMGIFDRPVKLAYGESRPMLDRTDVLEIANARLTELLAKWRQDVVDSGLKNTGAPPPVEVWAGFQFDRHAATKDVLDFVSAKAAEEHVSSKEDLKSRLMDSYRAGFQTAAGNAAAQQARDHALKLVLDPKLEQKIRTKVQYENNEQLGRIVTPVSSEAEHHEFEPVSITKVVKGDLLEVSYTTRKGQKFEVVFDTKLELTLSIVGMDLSLKATGDEKGRGVTQDSPGFISNESLNRSHLIADEFKGSGYKEALNLISTSDHYNQVVMRGRELDIGRYLASMSATLFTLKVDVTWGEILDQSIIERIAKAPWFKAEYANSATPKDLEKELRAQLAKSPKLKRCLMVDYKVTIANSTNVLNIGKSRNFDPIEADEWLLLDKKS